MPMSSRVRADSRDWACIALALALAAVVYQPWTGRSLPLPDFGTFLPLIDRSQGWFTQLSTVTAFYAGEGRLCVFPYMLFVFGANAFGTWAPGWYLTYFALTGVVVTLFWFVLRAVGLPRPASFLATVLWIPMTATTELWLRPTGEPFALMFFLSAMLVAIRYGESMTWRRDAFIIAVLCVGIVYSKEILIALLPVGWVVSRLSWHNSGLEWRAWGPRDSFLVSAVVGFVGVALVPVAWAALTAGDGSYASGFGEGGVAGSVLTDRIGMVLLPTRPELDKLFQIASDPAWFLLLMLPNLVWLRLVAGGIWKGRRSLVWPLAISLLWAGLGLVAYSPWKDPQSFYMAPFALGAMFGAAHVFAALMKGSRAATVTALALGGALVVISSVEANTRMLRYRMRADLNYGVLNSLAASGSVAEIGAAVPALPREQRLGWARHLEGFAEFSAADRDVESRDYTCDEARKALQDNPRIAVVSRDRGCGRLLETSVAIDKSTTRAQWPYLWVRHPVADRVYVTRSGSRAASARSAVGPVQAPL